MSLAMKPNSSESDDQYRLQKKDAARGIQEFRSSRGSLPPVSSPGPIKDTHVIDMNGDLFITETACTVAKVVYGVGSSPYLMDITASVLCLAIIEENTSFLLLFLMLLMNLPEKMKILRRIEEEFRCSRGEKYWLLNGLSKLPGLYASSGRVVLDNPPNMDSHVIDMTCLKEGENPKQRLDNGDSTEVSPNKNDNGSHLSNSTTGGKSQEPPSPNPDDIPGTNGGGKKKKLEKFWTKMSGYVLTLATAVAICLAVFGTSPFSSASSPNSFSAFAAMNGVGFVSSFIALVAGDKKPRLVKGFASIGAIAEVFIVSVLLAQVCYPTHAILVGAISCIGPLLALIARAST